ncbi:MAG: D-glycero-alpha-D-manno-heptose-1,7-bisphosphate 7-phosphatase [Chthoniobacterales bacterium]
MARNDAAAPAVFLDRDGTLMEDVDYCGDARNVRVFPGAADALRRLKDGGFRIIVITNQSGIGRGYFTEADYASVHDELVRQLGAGLLDGAYYCPHKPDENCSCRKPLPQLVFDATRAHTIDLGRSFFVGDKSSDLDCGRNAGVKTVLVRTGYGRLVDSAAADFVADDLGEAADIVLGQR